ncbi:hypothetical protein DP939_33525 [Spongiactinospora rosea]|uniref:Uncharacterized protein n=1 Tax=Spongiactinospora rosea TaxID=2248750 RepID=A0A366LPQ7_9ACTN|nr:hypothetical protein DP939_33525 [Spongiactinospora rosea]
MDCYPIPVVVQKWCPCPPPPCLTMCRPAEWAIKFRTDTVLPESLQFQYVADVTRGFLSLHEAARTSDAAAKANFRFAALESFQSGARALLGRRVWAERVGVLDREAAVLGPQPVPWLVAAAYDIADGMNILLRTDGTPSGNGQRAMPEFDEAYREFMTQTPIGG